MTEFELNGKSYRIEKLSAFQQFHVSRKIAPLVPTLIPIFLQFAAASRLEAAERGAPEGQSGGIILALLGRPGVLQPFADALSLLKNADAEYVMSTCLSVVRWHVGGQWLVFWNDDAKMPNDKDMNDMSRLMPLIVHVIKDSLGNFLDGLLSSQSESVALNPAPAAVA
jgi:hypothetical protein